MAAAEHIKNLIKFFGDGDDDRFYAVALQIAASEAKKGHTAVAHDLKALIEKAKKNRDLLFIDRNKTIPILHPKRELKELIDVFQPQIRLKDMILAPEVKDSLNRLILEQQSWDTLQKYNLRPRRKLLLVGPPGCGKTMTAQAIAGELRIPVFIVRLDGVVSKYMGESIAKLRLIFDAMPENRGVYLFDEFDSIGSHRNQGQDLGEIKRILNSFLVNIEKDQSNSIIIAATNLPEMLDKALFRRFDDVIEYPLPTLTEIEATLKKSLQAFPFEKDIDWVHLAKSAAGLNYSEIISACEDAIKDMILSGQEQIAENDLIKAIQKRK